MSLSALEKPSDENKHSDELLVNDCIESLISNIVETPFSFLSKDPDVPNSSSTPENSNFSSPRKDKFEEMLGIKSSDQEMLETIRNSDVRNSDVRNSEEIDENSFY